MSQLQNAQTKEDVIKLLGEPTSQTNNNDAFFAHSYQEDCFLAGGGRYRFDQRLEWKNENKYVVVYLIGNKVINFFV